MLLDAGMGRVMKSRRTMTNIGLEIRASLKIHISEQIYQSKTSFVTYSSSFNLVVFTVSSNQFISYTVSIQDTPPSNSKRMPKSILDSTECAISTAPPIKLSSRLNTTTPNSLSYMHASPLLAKTTEQDKVTFNSSPSSSPIHAHAHTHQNEHHPI